MHLISVTSDFNHKYSLFNGQVFLTVHITKITEPWLSWTYFEQKSVFELVFLTNILYLRFQTLLDFWLSSAFGTLMDNFGGKLDRNGRTTQGCRGSFRSNWVGRPCRRSQEPVSHVHLTSYLSWSLFWTWLKIEAFAYCKQAQNRCRFQYFYLIIIINPFTLLRSPSLSSR